VFEKLFGNLDKFASSIEAVHNNLMKTLEEQRVRAKMLEDSEAARAIRSVERRERLEETRERPKRARKAPEPPVEEAVPARSKRRRAQPAVSAPVPAIVPAPDAAAPVPAIVPASAPVPAIVPAPDAAVPAPAFVPAFAPASAFEPAFVPAFAPASAFEPAFAAAADPEDPLLSNLSAYASESLAFPFGLPPPPMSLSSFLRRETELAATVTASFGVGVGTGAAKGVIALRDYNDTVNKAWTSTLRGMAWTECHKINYNRNKLPLSKNGQLWSALMRPSGKTSARAPEWTQASAFEHIVYVLARGWGLYGALVYANMRLLQAVRLQPNRTSNPSEPCLTKLMNDRR
jgi:hypothetical protein